MRYHPYNAGSRTEGGLDLDLLARDGDEVGLDDEAGLFFLIPLVATAVKAATKPAVNALIKAREREQAAKRAARLAQQAARKAPEGPVAAQAQAQAQAAQAKVQTAKAETKAAKAAVISQRELVMERLRAAKASPAHAGSTPSPTVSSGLVVIGNVHQHPGILSGPYRALPR